MISTEHQKTSQTKPSFKKNTSFSIQGLNYLKEEINKTHLIAKC